MDLELEGKVALVTAASRGLGRAVATELAREGTRVVISSRDENRLSSTAAEVGDQTGAEMGYFPADLFAKGDVEALVSHVVDYFGGVDNLSTIPADRLLGASTTSGTRRGERPSSRF